MKLKPYPVYKDSGVPWLGEVPEHWAVLPNRAIFTEVIQRDLPDEQMLSVTITKGVIRQQTLLADSSKRDSSNLDKSAYKLVQSGDIVYNKMRAWQGAVGVSNYRGIVSPAYVVQRPRAGAESRYLHYLFRTPAFAKEAERWSYGITSDMWSLRPEHFKMIYGCLPPLAEQAAIVRFLDHVDRQLRHYIRAKQQLIKLLEEQKQTIIHKAVTRGLDPNVRLKPSGVEWLGEVPQHWEVMVAKRVCDVFIPQRNKPELNTSEGIPWVTLDMIGRELIKPPRFFVRAEDADGAGSRIVPSGCIVASCIGRFGISSITLEPVITNQQIQAYIPKTEISLAFFRHCVQIAKHYFEMQGNSTTLAYVDREAFGNMPLSLPPLSEQRTIVSHLRDATAKVDASIDRAEHEISLLREYRTRLITDVVTGKLDVRNVELPEVEELEAQEDWEEDTDVEAEGVTDAEEAADADE